MDELIAAVAAYDHETAEALVAAGADPCRVLPDGTTALLRSVEGGSPALVSALLHADPGARWPEPERVRLLAAARELDARGAEAELRRRAGADGLVERRWVEEWWADVEEFTLGGLTVRDGYAGVLTTLEAAFGVRTPLAELMARAVRHPDPCHAVWAASRHAVGPRPDAEAWAQVLAFHRHPSAAYRLFVADCLYSREERLSPGAPWYEEERRLLHAWAAGEPDAGVLAQLLKAFPGEEHMDGEGVGLLHRAHPDPRVRREVPHCFGMLDVPLTDRAREALHAMAGDPDARVRSSVADALAHAESTAASREVLLRLLGDAEHAVRLTTAGVLAAWAHHRTPEVVEALAALLDQDDRMLRLEGAYGLARRDDPRTPEAYERVGPLGPEFEHDTRADELWRWRFRQRPTG
ncbi:HEAT repeat domain-containing protein [Streptomyces sp. NPDC002138]|uniref:HEAT repeat domain-containing protein n=1 Tax=Streptomyces sp. NPDC002138 TaxID=3154410 RepID=UPI00332285BC